LSSAQVLTRAFIANVVTRIVELALVRGKRREPHDIAVVLGTRVSVAA
jgi:hypothetical protein